MFFFNYKLINLNYVQFAMNFFTKLFNNNLFYLIVWNLEIFTNLYKELNTYYVDDVDPSGLMRTGIDAMLKSLDPYTNYFSEAQIAFIMCAKQVAVLQPCAA